MFFCGRFKLVAKQKSKYSQICFYSACLFVLFLLGDVSYLGWVIGGWLQHVIANQNTTNGPRTNQSLVPKNIPTSFYLSVDSSRSTRSMPKRKRRDFDFPGPIEAFPIPTRGFRSVPEKDFEEPPNDFKPSTQNRPRKQRCTDSQTSRAKSNKSRQVDTPKHTSTKRVLSKKNSDEQEQESDVVVSNRIPPSPTEKKRKGFRSKSSKDPEIRKGTKSKERSNKKRYGQKEVENKVRQTSFVPVGDGEASDDTITSTEIRGSSDTEESIWEPAYGDQPAEQSAQEVSRMGEYAGYERHAKGGVPNVTIERRC